jgi:hypothetical protein
MLNKIFSSINTKIAILLGLTIIAGALAYSLKSSFLAASVNGNFITRYSVVQRLEKASGAQVLDSLISESLVLTEAKKGGVVVSNADIEAGVSKITQDLESQGATLEIMLQFQGLTEEAFRKQLMFQLLLEKMFVDLTIVTEEDINVYLVENSIQLPPGDEETFRKQVREQIKNERLGQAVEVLLTKLRSEANIKYYIEY